MFLPSASAETAETSRVPGHTAAACLSLHLKPAGLLQLTSLRTAVVDHRSPSARAERRCAARSGLATTRPRQFCTPDITLAAHLLPDTVRDRTTPVQCTRWPVAPVTDISDINAVIESVHQDGCIINPVSDYMRLRSTVQTCHLQKNCMQQDLIIYTPLGF